MTKELITFLAVTLTCLGLTLHLGLSTPAEKGLARYFVHGVFSALFAVPTGVAWRSWRQATGNGGSGASDIADRTRPRSEKLPAR